MSTGEITPETRAKLQEHERRLSAQAAAADRARYDARTAELQAEAASPAGRTAAACERIASALERISPPPTE